MEALETLVGNMTISELAERSQQSLNDIVAFALGEPVERSKPKVVKHDKLAEVVSLKKPTKTETTDINTRTPSGRAVYDAAVYAHLKVNKGQWMSAGDLRKACGGTGLQVRTALARLLEDETVEYEGNARGTKYRA